MIGGCSIIHLLVEVKRFFKEMEMSQYAATSRKTVGGRSDAKYFSRTASHSHFMNVKPRPMRGGIRL